MIKCRFVLRGLKADDSYIDHSDIVQADTIEDVNHLVIEEALRLRNTYHYDRIKYLSLIEVK